MNWKQSFQEAARYSDPNRPLSRETCPRDKEVCQGCLEEKAVDALYLTYVNIGEEVDES